MYATIQFQGIYTHPTDGSVHNVAIKVSLLIRFENELCVLFKIIIIGVERGTVGKGNRRLQKGVSDSRRCQIALHGTRAFDFHFSLLFDVFEWFSRCTSLEHNLRRNYA